MLKFLVQIIFVGVSFGSSLNGDCGDWVPFKDEKCFKAFDSPSAESVAEKVCKENSGGSVLAIIKTIEEQEIIDTYLKKTNIADNVWIGIKKSNNSFKHLDGTDINYKNWAKDRPLENSTDLNCVEISVHEKTFGKWIEEKCEKKNAVLCQKIPPWSKEKLQNTLIEVRKFNKEKITELTNELDTLKRTTITDPIKVFNEKIEELKKVTDSQKSMIDSLRSNPVPIGFIYVQLSGQSEPKTFWPNTEWDNISSKYSGLFFRAEGGQSSLFGQIQEQQTQSFEITTHRGDFGNKNVSDGWNKITETPFGKYYITGGGGVNPRTGINMKHNSEEIRPRNQAIRIWQRIK